jgi:hypothetical protein
MRLKTTDRPTDDDATDRRPRACVRARSADDDERGTRDGVRDVHSTRGCASRVARDDGDGAQNDDDDDEDGAGGAFGAVGDARGCVEARGRRDETIWETRRRANARDAVHERII